MSRPLSHEKASQLTACFEALAEPVFAYAMWATKRDRALAEDVVQQVFQAATERWAKLCDLSSDQRLTRLKAIARRKAINAYRRSRTALACQGELARRSIAHDRGIHERAMARAAVCDLWSVIERLPERQFQIALMRFREDMAIGVIAAELKFSNGLCHSGPGRSSACKRRLPRPVFIPWQ